MLAEKPVYGYTSDSYAQLCSFLRSGCTEQCVFLQSTSSPFDPINLVREGTVTKDFHVPVSDTGARARFGPPDKMRVTTNPPITFIPPILPPHSCWRSTSKKKINSQHTFTLPKSESLVCLFVLTGSSKGSQLLHELLGCKCLAQRWYLLTPCLTWDFAVHGLTHCYDLEHLLVGR